MQDTTMTTSTLELGDGQLRVVEGRCDARLRVLQGMVWLTLEGDPDDAVLTAGSEVPLRDGRGLIEGVGPTRVQLMLPVGRRPRPLAASLRHAWHSVRQHVARLQLGAVAMQPPGGDRPEPWLTAAADAATGTSSRARSSSPADAIRGRRPGIRPA